MTPAHERKAKERKAKQAAGLVRVEVWVPREMADVARSFMLAVVKENAGPKTATEIVEMEKNAPRQKLDSVWWDEWREWGSHPK